MKIETPMRLGRGKNDREHPMERHRRVKKQKHSVGWLMRQFNRPQVPVVFRLTRCAPSSGLDSDNLVESLAAVRDAIAEWMAVNDRDETLVRYEYQQAREPWGCRIEWEDPR